MALTKASDILGLEKIVKEIAVPIGSISASKVTVDLPDFTATDAAGAFEELNVKISDLSASVLTIGEKIENVTTYSTEEQEIGKWVDGSPLYRKTINGTVAIASTSRAWYNLVSAAALGNIANVLPCVGSNIIDPGDGIQYPIPITTGISSGASISAAYDQTNGLRLCAEGVSAGNATYSITLQYTKITETKKRTTKKGGN